MVLKVTVAMKLKFCTLSGQFWKWRMHGGAVTIADKFNKMKWVPDIIVCTDMMDLTVFISLSRKKIKDIPVVLYFHENQLSYPWKPTIGTSNIKGTCIMVL